MKKIIALLLAVVMVLGLAACGQAPAPAETKAPEAAAPAETNAPETEAEAPAEVETFTLKVWGPSEDQVPQEGQTVSFLEAACEAFDDAHPEWEIDFVYEVCSEGDAGTMVTKDPSAAADVYTFANDQLGTLLQANAIARLGGDVLAQVEAENTDTMIASVTSGEGVYGVPFTGNSWFMYYDKSVYTEEDIKSLDAMMAIKPVAFPITNTWNLPAFYYAVGGTMIGDGTDGAQGVKFGGEAGASATLYIANAVAAGTMFDDANGAGKDMLKNGQIGAMFSGTWDAEELSKILGDNYAAAQLPSITVNGAECQMKAFSGSKANAANPNSANIRLLPLWLHGWALLRCRSCTSTCVTAPSSPLLFPCWLTRSSPPTPLLSLRTTPSPTPPSCSPPSPRWATTGQTLALWAPPWPTARSTRLTLWKRPTPGTTA